MATYDPTRIPTVKLDEATSHSTSTSSMPSARNSLNSLSGKKIVSENGECALGQQCSMVCANDSDKTKRRSFCCNTVSQSVWGVLLIIISIGGFIFTPLDFMLWEKLNMRPGMPPYEWWSDPPDEVLLRIYVFNVTNHQRFLQGHDKKIHVEEIGPIVYLEKLKHYNVVFNDNGTLSYTAKRFLVYLPEKNTIHLNSTIVVPNLAALGIASQLHDANYFVRTGFKMLMNTHATTFFNEITIREYLWDYKDSILDTTRNLVPHMVPTTNMGILRGIYAGFTDDVTVMISPQWGHKNFFKIDKFNHAVQLQGYDAHTCHDRITGATEGVMYNQHLSKDDVLSYLRKTVCKALPLYFDKEVTIDSVPVYRFNLTEVAFNRIKNGTDCYDANKRLPDGVTDTSKCFDGLPMVASYPHFYTGSPPRDFYVTGLTPDREKHNSYALVEPLTGTPFRALARMQCNILVQNLSLFNEEKYKKFSELIIPLAWLEYSQEGLPTKIRYTVYFMVVILPTLSAIVLTVTLLVGFYCIVKQLYRVKKDLIRPYLWFDKEKNYSQNKVLAYESESFIKMHS